MKGTEETRIKNFPADMEILPGRGQVSSYLGRRREHIIMLSFSERYACCSNYRYQDTPVMEVDWDSIILCQNCKRIFLAQHSTKRRTET